MVFEAAQVLSTTGAVPLVYRELLSTLQDDCKPRSFSAIVPALENALECSLSSVFDEVKSDPVAAASIGQVSSQGCICI